MKTNTILPISTEMPIKHGNDHKIKRCCSRIAARIVALLSIAIFSIFAEAQTTTSNVEGTVRDANGAVVAGAQVKLGGSTLGVDRTIVTDDEGFYRFAAVPAGNYSVTVTQSGFSVSRSDFEVTLNRTVTANIDLKVGDASSAEVTVTAEPPLIVTDSPATGMTVTPQQIRELPVNGRNYLDLLQLVPGVAVNRQADPEGDNASPALGERSGNNNFFIDGHPNKDTVSGGAAAQFNQETIAEFQVLTTGYKAEFGQASGAIVNVITKSGGNAFHGVGSFFLRNEAFDASNSLDPAKTDPPHLRRFDYSVALGGPIIKDRFFFFGSAERITEDRQIDFRYPPFGNATLDSLIRGIETPFDYPSESAETRFFLKLNQELDWGKYGQHSFSQEVNYTNGNIYNYAPLSAGNSLPSTRRDRGSRYLLLAFGDTMLLGDRGNPWIVSARGAYRSEPSDNRPSHPETGGGSLLVPYAVPVIAPLQLPGPLGTASFGTSQTRSFLEQEYVSLALNVNKKFGNHDIKFGWNYLKTKVDGLAARTLQNQLFATIPDLLAFEPAAAGIRLLLDSGGVVPQNDEIHLSNYYNAFYLQDDWKILKNLTLNLGVRWDNDSEFDATKNFAPRLGATWAITQKTVIRGQFGIFYDQFRLGIASNVPPFGGANQQAAQDMIFPRGLYGSPNFVSSYALLALPSGGPCFSNVFMGNLTDAQIGSSPCPVNPARPFIGVDRLNRVVAPGHALIPANSVITVNNIQTLSGLTPDQYLAAANTAVGFPGFFTWGTTGFLTNRIIPPFGAPNVLEHMDETPNTLGYSVGVQHEIFKDMVIEADYHHREMRNMLGLHMSNLAFRSRVTGRAFDTGTQQIIAFGPYYEGKYDGLVVGLNKRFSHHFLLGANYTYAKATDNSRGVGAAPSDHFIGVAPVVTQAATATCPAQTNQSSSFIVCGGNFAGNFVAQAGTFVNGPDQDKGPSDLALDHIFQVNGMVSLPWQFQISGIFRAQSGFHHNRLWQGTTLIDPDGDGNTNGIDTRNATRNQFTAPSYVNLDLRFSKSFDIGDRFKFDIFYEMFNVFNARNPASIETNPVSTTTPFGKATQVLPGREGQIGVRIEF